MPCAAIKLPLNPGHPSTPCFFRWQTKIRATAWHERCSENHCTKIASRHIHIPPGTTQRHLGHKIVNFTRNWYSKGRIRQGLEDSWGAASSHHSHSPVGIFLPCYTQTVFGSLSLCARRRRKNKRKTNSPTVLIVSIPGLVWKMILLGSFVICPHFPTGQWRSTICSTVPRLVQRCKGLLQVRLRFGRQVFVDCGQLLGRSLARQKARNACGYPNIE